MEKVKERAQETKMDMQQMMKVVKELGTPGEPHKNLAKMEGNWDVKIKSWMDPDMPPKESTGTSKQEMLLGGRYLRDEESGDMMGAAYSGIQVTGFDNQKKKYFSTWMDSMGTGILLLEGTASPDGKTVTMESSMLENPVKGPMKFRAVTKIIDENKFVFELSGIDKKGKESKMMESTYTRK